MPDPESLVFCFASQIAKGFHVNDDLIWKVNINCLHKDAVSVTINDLFHSLISQLLEMLIER